VANPGFGVYVHWPFCAQKCPYCDFNSHVRFGGWDEARFGAAYLRELAHIAGRLGRRSVSSIFFGGGTPSLMQPSTVEAVLDAIAGHWTIEPGAEITLEANPGSVEQERFRGYRAAGVNRVSLGVQSLHDADLKRLGRIHSAAEARAAIATAQATFERSTFDLIYARPGQTAGEWRAELADALKIAQGHLSLYQLTIEPETPFAALHAAGKLVVPDPEVSGALWDVTQELTAEAGLPAYEISNHAAPGQESRHNLLYWRYGEYAGIGAGAHGRLIAGEQRLATATEKRPESWAELVEQTGHGVIEEAPISAAEAADEMLLMGLRLTEGIDLNRLADACNLQPSAARVEDLRRLGLIERIGNNRIRASGEGRFILNEIVLQLSRGFEPVAA
jgi:putative oxygen-independent coproporphyrinogen III oxidase